jgi:hypothetical protein
MHRMQNLKIVILYFYSVTSFCVIFVVYVHKVCGGECDLEHVIQKRFLKVFREDVKILSCSIQ